MDERSKQSTRPASPKASTERVTGLDLSFQGLRTLSLSLFLLGNLKELILDNNELESIPKDICKFQCLVRLSLMHNRLRCIPPELGKVVSLRELFLNDNLLLTVPMELGTLYNLETLTIHNNPLIAPFNALTKDCSLIHFCRENNTSYPAPADRAWIDIVLRKVQPENTVLVGTYNILCNFYAAKCTYAPTWIINQEIRRESILQNILSYNVDILCLQEIESYSYMDFYSESLNSKLGYASVFQARERTRPLPDKRAADGAAIFWKRDRFTLKHHHVLDFNKSIQSDERFTSNNDITMRMSRKDNMVLIVYLMDRSGHMYIVLNTHLYWNPEYADVKLFQAILLLEEIVKMKNEYPYASFLLLGDFNSTRDSSVYDLIVKKSTNGTDFNLYDYSPFKSGFSHTLCFRDAYENQDLTFTNYTPTFKEVIDYIFYDQSLEVTTILSPVEDEYTSGCVGLPSIHFPSDHIFIATRLALKKRE